MFEDGAKLVVALLNLFGQKWGDGAAVDTDKGMGVVCTGDDGILVGMFGRCFEEWLHDATVHKRSIYADGKKLIEFFENIQKSGCGSKNLVAVEDQRSLEVKFWLFGTDIDSIEYLRKSVVLILGQTLLAKRKQGFVPAHSAAFTPGEDDAIDG